MPKIKKKPEVKYGIEITKPHSKEMYNHNDKIAEEMRINIAEKIYSAYERAVGNLAANGGMDKGEKDLRFIVQSFTGYSFGAGYELIDVREEGIKTLNDAANWMLHEEYSYLCFKGIVPRTSKMMVGFDWEKHDYSEIEEGYDGALNENFDGREEYYK